MKKLQLRPAREEYVPTEQTARRVLALLDFGLPTGLGQAKPGKMCVEAAVCYAMGADHSDQPRCVSGAVSNFKIEVNDRKWSSNAARGRGLRAIAIAQLGSNKLTYSNFGSALRDVVVGFLRGLALKELARRKPDFKFVRKINKSVKECSEFDGFNFAITAHEVFKLLTPKVMKRLPKGKDARNLQVANIGLLALIEAGSPGVKYLKLLK